MKPKAGDRFFHPTWGGRQGSIVTVTRTGTGGRWGKGYIAWRFENCDGSAPLAKHRTTCLSTWPAFSREMVPIEDCNACLVDADAVPPQRITDCSVCGGKGWIPAPLKP